MKVVLTAGGSGGHFYPLVAVADEVYRNAESKKLLKPKIYYLADKPYDAQVLFRKEIEYRQISAGKMRCYFSIKNFFDMFKTAWGLLKTTWLMFRIYPDVVFTNGSYVAVPVLFAARLLRIPVMVHASDSIPSRAVMYGAKFAKRVSTAFVEASEYLPPGKTALLGNPIRDELMMPLVNGAHEFLELDSSIPTIFVQGGSLGSEAINDAIVDALPQLLYRYNVIHQTGKTNLKVVKGRAGVLLHSHPFQARYKAFGYLDVLAMRMSAGAADLIVTRAGAGNISEAAQWGKASILIPIPNSISRDQEKNAFSYARTKAAIVIKQPNLTASILTSEIDRIITNPDIKLAMEQSAKQFAKPDAAQKIAEEIVNIAQSHE